MIVTSIDVRATLDRFEFVSADLLKHPDDLVRYRDVIQRSEPDVLVECGTRTGASAAWFAGEGIGQVISIDTWPRPGDWAVYCNTPRLMSAVEFVTGSSVDPLAVEHAARLCDGLRVMVVLDSAHTALHVQREIQLWGPLVTVGCHLVVEDTIFAYAGPEEWEKFKFGPRERGNPLDAVLAELVTAPGWERDLAVEGMSEISHHPGGWWRRTA